MPIRDWKRRQLALASSLLTLALCGCDSRPAAPATPASALSLPTLRNLLLISIDTLRPDRLGCYGDKRGASPNIDRVASEGVLFEQCTTVAPQTLPAHSSLLTGTYPFVHGVRDNAGFVLAPENESLAESLAGRGFRTGAEIAAAVLNRELGLDQGFATYGDVRGDRPAGVPPERSAAEIAEAGLAFLANPDARPFFLFLHFFDPHLPHLAPEPFRARFGEDTYQAEIAYADSQIGRVLDALRASGRDKDTVVIITADHGESLGQHQERTHGLYVYDATLSIPLLIRAPGVLPSARRIAAQTRIIDIAPTAAALIGASPPADAQGLDLRALARGEAPDPHLGAYSESLYAKFNFELGALRSLRVDGWKYIYGPEPELYDIAHDPGETKNLVASEAKRAADLRAKLLKTVESARPVAGARVGLTAEQQRNLTALGYAGAINVDAVDERALLEPGGVSPMKLARELNECNDVMMLTQMGQFSLAEQKLRGVLERNPELSKGFYGVFAALGGALAAQGKFEEAAQYLEKSVEGNPRDGLSLLRLGVARTALERYGPAIEAIELALAQGADTSIGNAFLALGLAAKGDLAGGREKLQMAAQVDPNVAASLDGLRDAFGLSAPASIPAAQRDTDLQLRLAAFALTAKVPAPGITILQNVLRATPRDELAQLLAGQLFTAAGRRAEAVKVYRAALEITPRVQTWNALGVLLMLMGEHAEAVKALDAGLALEPNHTGLLVTSAWLLANTPDDKLRDAAKARGRAEQARQAAPEDATVLDVLASTFAAGGDFDAALKLVDAAITAARAERDLDLLRDATQRRKLYEARKPFRLPTAASTTTAPASAP